MASGLREKPVTRAAFFAALEALGRDPEMVSFGVVRDESYVVRDGGSGFEVFYSERGLETCKQWFASEGEALRHLLDLLS